MLPTNTSYDPQSSVRSGGVLLDIDFNKSRMAFEAIGYPRFQELYHPYYASTLFADFETGALSETDFLHQLQQLAPAPVSQEQIIEAWNALLGSYRWQNLELLPGLSSQFRLLLFSNTNSIHYTSFQQQYLNKTGKHFDDLFDQAFYSHLLGHRKPDTSAFKKLIALTGIVAAETLFIDDSLPNIEGAAATGLQTHHLQEGESVAMVVNRLRGF